jgi:hypothetical protein
MTSEKSVFESDPNSFTALPLFVLHPAEACRVQLALEDG